MSTSISQWLAFQQHGREQTLALEQTYGGSRTRQEQKGKLYEGSTARNSAAEGEGVSGRKRTRYFNERVSKSGGAGSGSMAGGYGSEKGSAASEVGDGDGQVSVIDLSDRASAMRERKSRFFTPPVVLKRVPNADDLYYSRLHASIVALLSNVYEDMGRLQRSPQGSESSDLLIVACKGIAEILEGVTVHSASRMQSMRLINDAVQLCMRIATSPGAALGQGYHPKETSHNKGRNSALNNRIDSNGSGVCTRGKARSEALSLAAALEEKRNKNKKAAAAERRKRSRKARRRCLSSGDSDYEEDTDEGWGGGDSEDDDQDWDAQKSFSDLASITRAHMDWARGNPEQASAYNRARETVLIVFMDSHYRRLLTRSMVKRAIKRRSSRILHVLHQEKWGGDEEQDDPTTLTLKNVGFYNITITAMSPEESF